MNGRSKLMKELDILNIIRDLRVFRFLSGLWLTPYQQQLVHYFKQYSLETKSIHPKEWRTFSKPELIDHMNQLSTIKSKKSMTKTEERVQNKANK